jgi:hypothetical protein
MANGISQPLSLPRYLNLTAAVVSFRTANTLKSNPARRFKIDTFRWENSMLFN